jgi:hypothetical protein
MISRNWQVHDRAGGRRGKELDYADLHSFTFLRRGADRVISINDHSVRRHADGSPPLYSIMDE